MCVWIYCSWLDIYHCRPLLHIVLLIIFLDCASVFLSVAHIFCIFQHWSYLYHCFPFLQNLSSLTPLNIKSWLVRITPKYETFSHCWRFCCCWCLTVQLYLLADEVPFYGILYYIRQNSPLHSYKVSDTSMQSGETNLLKNTISDWKKLAIT